MITDPASRALTRVNQNGESSRKLLEGLAGGPLPHWAEFCANIQLHFLDAGTTVFAQGAEHPFVYVVRRGLFKNVYIREDGEAWIKSFSCEGQFFASISALQPGGLCSFSAIAIENGELERFPFRAIERLAENNILWSNMLRRAIMAFAARKEQRERELLMLNAENCYRQFCLDQCGLEQRITQKDLAAYLGVTPVGLNRIVRRVRGNGGQSLP